MSTNTRSTHKDLSIRPIYKGLPRKIYSLFMTAKLTGLVVSLLLCMSWFFSSSALAGIGLQERLAMLSERIANSPDNPDIYLRRALIYSDTGEFKLALTDVDTAAQFGPIENTYFVKGIIFYRLGQFEQAVPLLDEFLLANPNHAEAFRYRGRILRDAGKRQAALADYQRFIELRPNAEPGDYVTVAQLMVDSPDYDDRDVVVFLDKRIAQLGYAPQLQGYAIQIEQQQCRNQAVVERLLAAHKSQQQAPQWHLQMAEQHWLLKQPALARQYLQSASEILNKRRPSAIRAELIHRQAFLTKLINETIINKTMAASSNSSMQSVDVIDEIYAQDIYAQFYPELGHAHDHDPNDDPDHPPVNAATHTHANHQAGNKAGDHNHHHDEKNDHQHSDQHQHAQSLSDLERPQTASTDYQSGWADAMQPFYQCLLQDAAVTATN